MLLGVLLGLAEPAAPAERRRSHVDVIEVSGLLDPVLVDFVRDAVRRADRSGSEALVLQLNSTGAAIPQAKVDALAFRLSHARTPIAVWIGPSGARAYGAAMALVRAAAVSGVAPGVRLGRATAPVFGRDPLRGRTVTGPRAVALRVADVSSPTLGDFIVELDGRTAGGRRLETADVVGTRDGPRRRPAVDVRFSKPGLLPRLLHAVSSPSVAFLLLVIGLLLVVFEFFTVGVGLAGLTGAGCLVLAAYGLGVLPTRPIGLALLALGIFGLAVDLQAGAPRAWTVIGVLSLAVGAANLYRGHSPGLLPMAVAVIGSALVMVPGMAAMVRARFSTPTVGRESMIGETGTAVTALGPSGTVEVRGAQWRARTNRATPVDAGAKIEVMAIDGVILEVAPVTPPLKAAGPSTDVTGQA